MAFSVTDQGVNPGDVVYYDPKFRTIIETHLSILRRPGMSGEQIIEPSLIHQFEGDFYGLLTHLGVRPSLWWIYLRVNGMESPNQFGGQLHDPYREHYRFTLKLPPDEFITNLRTLFLTTQT